MSFPGITHLLLFFVFVWFYVVFFSQNRVSLLITEFKGMVHHIWLLLPFIFSFFFFFFWIQGVMVVLSL